MRNQEPQVLLATSDIQLEHTMARYPFLFSLRPVYAARVFPTKVKLIPLRPNLYEKVLIGTDERSAALEKFDTILGDENLQNYFHAQRKNWVTINRQEVWYADARSGTQIRVTLQNGEDAQIGAVVCGILAEAQSMGYRVLLETDIPSLSPYLALLSPVEGSADLTLFLTKKTVAGAIGPFDLNSSIQDREMRVFSKELLNLCRRLISDDQFRLRNESFIKSGIGKLLQLIEERLDGSGLFYKTVNRNIFDAPPAAVSLYRKLSQNITDSQTPRWCWEWFYKICYYEAQKENEYNLQLSSPFLKICNLPDTIVSFLGSRRCNLRCKYCFSDHEKEKHEPLSDIDIVNTLEFCRELSSAETVHVDNGLGGEPSLEFSAIQHTHTLLQNYHTDHQQYASFGLLTNGTNMTKEQLVWVREHIPYLGFSLDGDQETNDRIRVYPDGKGTYTDAVQLIRYVQENHWPVPIGVSCVLTANNLNLTKLFRHIYEELDVHFVTIKPVRASASAPFALTVENLPALEESYRHFLRYLLQKAESGDLGPLFAILHPIDYLGRFLARTGLEDRVIVKRCGAGEHIFSVDNGHRVYACDSFNGEEAAYIGSWETGRTGMFQVPFVGQAPGLPCGDCWARYSCGGVCPYVRHLSNGKITDVVRFECQFAQSLIRESLLFWDKAKKRLPKTKVEAIYRHMDEMGFSKFKQHRDHFFYAPC